MGCSVQSMKDRKPGKYFSTSSGVCSLFVILYIFCGIGIQSHQIFNLLDVSAYVTLIQIKEKASQGVSYVKTIVNQKHKKSVFHI